MKVCPKCQQEKEEKFFGKDKSRKDGLNPWCKSCVNESSKSYRENNPDKVRATFLNNKEKYKARYKTYNIDKERKKAYFQEWLNENKEAVKDYRSKWYHENKDLILMSTVNKEKRALLVDPYLKKLAKAKGYTKEMLEQYPIILDLIKASILNHRLIKNLKNDNGNQ